MASVGPVLFFPHCLLGLGEVDQRLQDQAVIDDGYKHRH